jgi:hypothetical protein
MSHVNAVVGIRIENIELTRMEANRRRPCAVAVLRRAEDVVRWLRRIIMGEDLPVGQILECRTGKPGTASKLEETR